MVLFQKKIKCLESPKMGRKLIGHVRRKMSSNVDGGLSGEYSMPIGGNSFQLLTLITINNNTGPYYVLGWVVLSVDISTKFRSCLWGSSLPSLCTLDPPLGHPTHQHERIILHFWWCSHGWSSIWNTWWWRKRLWQLPPKNTKKVFNGSKRCFCWKTFRKYC